VFDLPLPPRAAKREETMMNQEPRNLHIDSTMPTEEGPIPVRVDLFLCESDGSGYCCQIQIKKKQQSQRLWVELRPEQARLLSRRLKAASKWMNSAE
jgi:hypothetical protein